MSVGERIRISRGQGHGGSPRNSGVPPFHIDGLTGAASPAGTDLLMISRGGRNFSLPLSALFIFEDVTLTVGVGQDFETLADALAYVDARHVAHDVTVTISIAAGVYGPLAAAQLNPHNGKKVAIVGATPISTVLTSVHSVSGSAGAWNVTINVASVAGLAAGMVVDLRGVKPGVQAPGSYTGRPVQGALQMQFFTCGRLSINGVSATTSDVDLETFADDGDLLVAGGAVREMTAVTNGSISPSAPSSFTIAGTSLPADVVEEPLDDEPTQYWYTMRSSSGTIAISGTAVTGSGTSFLSQLNPGDLIAASGGGMRKVASVADDTHLTLTKASMDMPAGTKWGVITPGELHECCAVITAVDVVNNRISYVNTSRLTLAPPVKNVSGGTLTVYPTALNFGTDSGFVVNGDRWSGNNLALVGGNGSANVGVNLRGFDDSRASTFTWGTAAAVVGFDYGARVGPRSWLDAAGATFSGSFVRGFDLADGANADLTGACIQGPVGYGLYFGTGSYARTSAILVTGCGSFGIRGDVGSSTWCDFGVSSWNVSDNFRMTNAMLSHVVGARLIGSQNSSGLTGENGGLGRLSGAIALCNNAHGLNLTGSLLEANYCMAIGNGSSGIVATDCPRFSLFRGHVGYNVVNGLQVLRAGKAAVDGSNFVGNTTHIRAADDSHVYAESCGFSDCVTQDCNATEAARISIKSYSSTLALVTTPALNVPDTSGAIVTDMTAADEEEGAAEALENYGGAAFDGLTNYFGGLALTGIADGKTGHFVWVGRPANDSAANEQLLNNTGNTVDIIRTTDGDIRVRLRNSAGQLILEQESTSQPIEDGDTQYAVFVSWDLANDLFQLYVQDAAVETAAVTPLANDTIDNTVAAYAVGGNTVGTLKYMGDKYLVRFGTEYVDWSSGTTRRLVIDADGNLAFQGRRGELVTGTAPELFLAYDKGAKFGQNKGSTGGSLTTHGTFTGPTEPIYGPYGTLFERGGIVTVTGDYTVGAFDTTIIVNNSGGATAITLPAASDAEDREIEFVTIQAQAVNSASSNVKPRAGGAAGTSILTGTAGNNGRVVSDGTDWRIVSGTGTA